MEVVRRCWYYARNKAVPPQALWRVQADIRVCYKYGITTACADKFGSDSYLVFDELIKAIQQVPQDGFIVAHDMDVKNTIMRNSLTPEQQSVGCYSKV